MISTTKRRGFEMFEKLDLILEADDDNLIAMAELIGADKKFFVGADLSGCDLRNTDFTGWDLTGANLDGAIMDETTILPPTGV